MAFKKLTRYCYLVASRADRRGMTATAELIREELECYRWSDFNSKVAIAVDLALIDSSINTLEDALPRIALESGYSVDELRKFPDIGQYFDYAKRTAKRYAEIEREMQQRSGGKD